MKYEHMLHCAQPISKLKPVGKVGQKIPSLVTKMKATSKKANVMSVILNKKLNRKFNIQDVMGSGTEYMSGLLPVNMESRKKTLEIKRKSRKRSTIMPVILKKLKGRLLQKDLADDASISSVQCAKEEPNELHSKNHKSRIQSYKIRSNYQNQAEENENILIGDAGFKSIFVSRLQNSPTRLQLVGYHGNCKPTNDQSNLITEDKNTSISSKSATQINERNKSQKYKEYSLKFSTNFENNSKIKQPMQSTVPKQDTTTEKIQAKPIKEKKAVKKKKYPTYSVKKLKPLKKFKKLERVSESCEMNFPADVPPNIDRDLERIMVDSADLNKLCRKNMPSFKLKDTTMAPRHLIRLPKTTPEGYRVLMYSVRDNDPTKMNFNDCVKGFCMYNDCILSEDGLQEGYIVIFDMKGVQIGHLARVSLPALRCFMSYIQEAHPCRLKGIHILNTASWIHHIMRLVVPLVKSELLNLVKFHKDSIPEGLPLEILPMDLGGDAPTIDELDKETKSMVHKYHGWLIETADFKSDESKRIKKASWWGFFNGTNKTNNVELDEKTILKNLQID